MKNTNIFEGAKFGDKFLTRDGNICLFIRKYYISNSDIKSEYYRFYILNDDEALEYNVFDGGYVLGIDNESPLDIVSRYKEPEIDEDELDTLAMEYVLYNCKTESGKTIRFNDSGLEQIYKDGYRKAKEE